MGFQNILFDLDGTLVDSLPGIEYALRGALRQVMPEIEGNLGELRSLIGPPVREIFQKILGGSDSSSIESLVQHFRVLYDAEGWKRSTVYEGVTKTLNLLRLRNVRCSVVTNKPLMPTLRILEMLQLSSYFETIAAPDMITPPFSSKVDLANYVVTKARLAPVQTLLVGDSMDDAYVAQTCHLAFAFASYGYSSNPITIKGCNSYVLRQFADLLEIL